MLALTACSAPSSASNATADSKPVPGGTLKFAQSDFPTCLDIAQSPYVPTPQQQVVDTYLAQDPKSGALKGWLATSVDVNSTATEYTIHLRKGVTFSNGEKLTATSVKNNFDNAIELGKQGHSPQASAYLLYYTGTTVVDDNTAKVDFSQPKAGFLQALSERPLGPLADASLAKSWSERCTNGVIGTGPFVISNVTQGQSVTLTGRKDYDWASPLAAHKGAPYLDKLVISVVADPGVRASSLLSGTVDVARDVAASSLPQVESSGAATIATKISGGVVPYLSINQADPLLKDASVRQAIQVGLDRKSIVSTLYTKYQPAATSILSPTVPGYVDLSKDLAYQPAKSKSLLEKDGYTLASDGYFQKDGKALELSLNFTAGPNQQLSELIQSQLKKVGIKLDLNLVTSAQSTQAISTGKWQLGYGNLTRPDPDVLVSSFDPKFAWTKPPADAYPDLVSVLHQITAQSDKSKRAALTARAQKLIVNNAYAIPINAQAQIVGISDKVHGFAFDADWWPLLYDVWISK